MRLSSLGMPVRTGANKWRDERYVAVRPNGRPSRCSFKSPIRAAQHAMQALDAPLWTDLCAKGWTVQPVSWVYERAADSQSEGL